jgi:CO/xanthine dehydrogenase Mo-binding subunit
MSGNAVLNAARELRRHLIAAAAALLEAAPGDIELAGSRAFVRGAPDRGLSMASVVKGATSQGRPVQALEKYDAPSAPTIDPTTGRGKAFNDYTFGTHAVEVEIDDETGRTRATRLVSCFDAGRVIHRANAEGQLEGGAVQGLGYALMEAIALDNGVSKNPHLADYKIPTSLDAPAITTVLLESGTGLGPFGAKGLGEPAMTPSIAAVANAVANALGTRITELPITSERVLAALRATPA